MIAEITLFWVIIESIILALRPWACVSCPRRVVCISTLPHPRQKVAIKWCFIHFLSLSPSQIFPFYFLFSHSPTSQVRSVGAANKDKRVRIEWKHLRLAGQFSELTLTLAFTYLYRHRICSLVVAVVVLLLSPSFFGIALREMLKWMQNTFFTVSFCLSHGVVCFSSGLYGHESIYFCRIRAVLKTSI